jgi:septation ring formation regulator EzrA
MTKYQEYFQKMMEANKELFASFRKIHDEYHLAEDTDSLQEKFNSEGEKIMAVVREWEGKLCSQSEKGGYGVFTGNLAEKFQAEVKKEFPMIDHVGIIVKKFSLKKINLS